MRNFQLLSAILFSLITNAQTAPKDISFYLQGGYRSSLFNWENGKQRLVSATESNHHTCIVLNTGLQVWLPNHWRIGAAFTYDHFGTQQRSVEISNLSYMLRCDKIWQEGKRYRLYSGVMAGLTKTRRFENEIETNRKLQAGYHLYLTGVEYELIKNIDINANLGWGVAGIVSVGAKYKF